MGTNYVEKLQDIVYGQKFYWCAVLAYNCSCYVVVCLDQGVGWATSKLWHAAHEVCFLQHTNVVRRLCQCAWNHTDWQSYARMSASHINRHGRLHSGSLVVVCPLLLNVASCISCCCCYCSNAVRTRSRHTWSAEPGNDWELSNESVETSWCKLFSL